MTEEEAAEEAISAELAEGEGGDGGDGVEGAAVAASLTEGDAAKVETPPAPEESAPEGEQAI
jgi:hypothetical protein